MIAAAAAGVAFARAVVLGIRDGLVGTAQAVAAGLGAGVQTVAARVTLARRSLAAPAAATVAFAQAATHGIRSRLVRTVHAIAARLGAGVEAVARVPLVRRKHGLGDRGGGWPPRRLSRLASRTPRHGPPGRSPRASARPFTRRLRASGSSA